MSAYVRAINADDCASMRALSDPVNTVEAWCGGITVSNLVIHDPVEDTCCGPGQDHSQVVKVPVEFRLEGADSSMPDGEHAWGYILVRDNDAERWRVASEGAG
ncbi:hypothetical protein ACOCJ7_16300 [Knoellia sp. CPCC 206453]|uniref:hypothetical protein n=1 Tax=Knoellia pratensis TaxID=3404796 RepID=UPI00361158F3